MIRQSAKIAKNYKRYEDELEKRTLNELSNKGKKMTAKDIQDETGLTQAAIKRSIKVKKARRNILEVVWKIIGRRLQFPGIRQIKRKGRVAGVSYLGKGKQRITRLDPVEQGSTKLFTIPGKFKGEKRIAVFRQAGDRKKTTTFAGHSVPFLLEKDWERRLKDRLKLMFPAERKRQKGKLKYVRANR
jgi:hypothetical protein